jgi:hypothetical protein
MSREMRWRRPAACTIATLSRRNPVECRSPLMNGRSEMWVRAISSKCAGAARALAARALAEQGLARDGLGREVPFEWSQMRAASRGDLRSHAGLLRV